MITLVAGFGGDTKVECRISSKSSLRNMLSTAKILQFSYIDKIKHHSTSNSNSWVPPYVLFLNRWKYTISLSFLLATLGIAVYAIGLFSNFANDSGFGYGELEAQIYSVKLYNDLGKDANPPNAYLLLSHPTWTVDNTEYRNAYFSMKQNILSSNLEILDLESMFDNALREKGTVSVDRHMCLVSAWLGTKYTRYDANWEPVPVDDFQKVANENSALKAYWGGGIVTDDAVNMQLSRDLGALETGAVPVLIVILFLVFGGVVAGLLPVILSIFTLIWTLAILNMVTIQFRVTNYALNALTVFGVGLAIDFTLFMHLRFVEEWDRAQEKIKNVPAEGASNDINNNNDVNNNNTNNNNNDVTTEEAKKARSSEQETETLINIVIQVMETSGRTVAFSAITLACTLSGALQFHEFFITTMSLSVMVAAVVAGIGSCTIIPCVYLMLGPRIFALKVPSFITQAFWENLVFQSFKSMVKGSESRGYGCICGQTSSATAVTVNGDEEDGGEADMKDPHKSIHAAEHGNYADIENMSTTSANAVDNGNADTNAGGGSGSGSGVHAEVNDMAITKTSDKPKSKTSAANTSPHPGTGGGTENDNTTTSSHKFQSNSSWTRFVLLVMSHPIPFVILILGGLAGFNSVFFLDINFNATGNVDSVPLGTPARIFQDTLRGPSSPLHLPSLPLRFT